MNKLIFTLSFILLGLGFSCKSQKNTTEQTADRPSRENVPADRRNSRGGPPSTDEIFQMDANNDGMLSINEVKGPLQKEFSKVDTNGDGFITRAEFEAAPKPQRKQGGGRGRN